MVRGTVIVESIKDLWEAYEYFKTMEHLNGILSIKDDLDDDIKIVTITFSYSDTLIGELKFRYGHGPPQMHAHTFLTELEKSNDAA